MKRYHYLISGISLIIFLSCNKLSDIEYGDFTMYKKFVFNEQLIIDGMYLNEKSTVYYLYRNGSIYSGFNSSEGNICSPITNEDRDIPFGWGFFNIIGSKFMMQRINSVSIQQNSKYQIDNYEGQIINDTTFIIEKYIDYRDNIEIKKDTFYFKRCLNKPDSMNIILRNIGI